MDPWAQWRKRSGSSSRESYSPWLMSQRSVTVTKSAEIWSTGGLRNLTRPAAEDDGVPGYGEAQGRNVARIEPRLARSSPSSSLLFSRP